MQRRVGGYVRMNSIVRSNVAGGRIYRSRPFVATETWRTRRKRPEEAQRRNACLDIAESESHSLKLASHSRGVGFVFGLDIPDESHRRVLGDVCRCTGFFVRMFLLGRAHPVLC